MLHAGRCLRTGVASGWDRRRGSACSGVVCGVLHGTATVPNAVRQPIVFVTDYGRDDAYAAALTGAAWRVDPHALCVDGTHGIPAGDVLAGAYQLKALALAFAEGAVFCAVVDPGVGTDRRAIAIEVGRIRCVAPDNGLISYLWEETGVVPKRGEPRRPARRRTDLPRPRRLRADRRATRVRRPARAAGEPIDDPIVLADAFAERIGTGLRGRVCVVDHFGNAITTIRAADIGAATVRSVSWQGGACAGLVTTYARHRSGRGRADRQRRPPRDCRTRCPGGSRWWSEARRRTSSSSWDEHDRTAEYARGSHLGTGGSARRRGARMRRHHAAAHGDRGLAGRALRVAAPRQSPSRYRSYRRIWQ